MESAVTEEANTTSAKKTIKNSRKGFQAPAGKINEILKEATKQDLIALKGSWAEMIGITKI